MPTAHPCDGACHADEHGACRKCILISLDGIVLGCPDCAPAAEIPERITAAAAGVSLSIAAAGITASATSRTLGGPVVQYGVYGRTSRGRLRVRPGALRFPEDITRVKLTEEHDRAKVRGYLSSVSDSPTELRVTARVSDGPEGDTALREASDRTRDAFSFDVVDATVEGDEITDALVIAVGQVGIPAYDGSVIDTIAASLNPEKDNMLTDEQRARLEALAGQETRTPEEQAELDALTVLAGLPATAADAEAQPAAPAAPETVQASAATVPAGVPAPRSTAAPASRTAATPRGPSLSTMVDTITAALQPGAGGAGSITAALADLTYAAHNNVINPPAWSGELWSGLQYEAQWADLFSTAPLTNFRGEGWRFKTKLEIQDYAGNKVEIPTSTVTTESSSYTAARMAVGLDIDRAYFDFPNEGFIQALFEQARESYAIMRDIKIRAYTLANAVAAEGVGAQPTLLKAAAVAVRALKRRRVGRATFVVVNDDDLFTLLDYAEKDMPAFLDMYGIDPRNFRSDQDVPAGTVLAGVKQAATFRELPGSPIRVDAQNITKAGIDEAFFAYWALEEHHTAGIAKATYTKPVA